MKIAGRFRTLALGLAVAFSVAAASAEAARPQPTLRAPDSTDRVGQWIASGGIGLTISPTSFLLSPQLEYVARPWLLVGPLVQLGISDFVLFTASASARFLIGHHPRVKPSVETALGLAVASAGYASSVGVHFMFGVGFDYYIEPTISLGTMMRANFTPPIKTFILSWPILVARFLL